MSAQQGVTVQWKNDKAESILVSKSLLKHYSDYPDSVSFFNVRVAKESTHIIGKYIISDDGIIFTPTWPFGRGMTYNLYWKDKLIEKILIPQKTGEESVIIIYPTVDTLPENILKFYLVFTKPMTEGNSQQYIRVFNEHQDTLQVLLEMKPELWNSDHTMLTCWVDPGRIKRDLLLQQELGKPLIENNEYSLLVLPGWKDADGIPTTTLSKKDFVTTNPDRKKPDINNWSVQKPKTKTKKPLTINFKEPMDYAVALRGLDVTLDGKLIQGKTMLSNGESVWTFTPEHPWTPGKYVLKINPLIEDLAGNNLQRLFDNDLEQNDSALSLKNKSFTIDFTID